MDSKWEPPFKITCVYEITEMHVVWGRKSSAGYLRENNWDTSAGGYTHSYSFIKNALLALKKTS